MEEDDVSQCAKFPFLMTSAVIDSFNSYFSHIKDLITIIEKQEGKKLEECEEEYVDTKLRHGASKFLFVITKRAFKKVASTQR
jgi:hypothetical protein